MKILIRNLDRKTTEEQVRELFESYGIVNAVALVMDEKAGHSKGFGFVEMSTREEGAAATKALNKSQLHGATIRVKISSKDYW